MIWRTQQGEQPQRWAISALRTPPRDRRMTLACRRLTALDSCRFIACSFLPSQGRSVLATTVSTIGSPHHNGCSNNRWRTYLRSKAARWKPSVRPGESHELETALVSAAGAAGDGKECRRREQHADEPVGDDQLPVVEPAVAVGVAEAVVEQAESEELVPVLPAVLVQPGGRGGALGTGERRVGRGWRAGVVVVGVRPPFVADGAALRVDGMPGGAVQPLAAPLDPTLDPLASHPEHGDGADHKECNHAGDS